MVAMAERVRREERELAATGAVHGGGVPMRFARSSSSHTVPGNDAARFSCGVGRGPGFPEAWSVRDDPNGAASHHARMHSHIFQRPAVAATCTP